MILKPQSPLFIRDGIKSVPTSHWISTSRHLTMQGPRNKACPEPTRDTTGTPPSLLISALRATVYMSVFGRAVHIARKAPQSSWPKVFVMQSASPLCPFWFDWTPGTTAQITWLSADLKTRTPTSSSSGIYAERARRYGYTPPRLTAYVASLAWGRKSTVVR